MLHNPRFLELKTLQDARKEINNVGSDPKSIDIMAPKAISKVIKLEKVMLQDAIIIKQDMLSLGGEVAVPSNTFKLYNKKGDIIIIGTIKQLKELVIKLKRHYSRLKNISKELSELIGKVI